MSLWTLAQQWDGETRLPPPPVIDWVAIAPMLIGTAIIAYAILVLLPRGRAEQRRNVARMIELLESIDRRLAAQNET